MLSIQNRDLSSTCFRFMEIILIVAVICNAALIAFTSEIVPRLYYMYAEPASNGTLVGYKQFSLSKMAVTDWDELHGYLKAHPMPDPTNSHKRTDRETHGGQEALDILYNSTTGTSALFNDTHTHCYYLDFRRDKPPYDLSPTWWKIFCLRVATFTTFIIVFYVLLFLCEFAISDIPSDVMKRLKRREFLVRSKWTTKKRQRDDEYAVAQFSQSRWLKTVRRATIFIPPASPGPAAEEGSRRGHAPLGLAVSSIV